VVTVDGASKYQNVNGFGFSEAFLEDNAIQSLSTSNQSAVADLLFSPTSGAGLDIVRFGIGGAGTAADQGWIAQEAKTYGVSQFYADAWSAPANMKTNSSENNGGYLCGSRGETCSSGDSRAAYAQYLAGQASAFQSAGIPLQYIGFVNEPEIGPGYASMLMSAAQAADFVPYLGQALASAGLTTKVACCDVEGWQDAAPYAGTVLGSSSAAPYVGLITAHGYTGSPTSIVPSQGLPVWETEWATLGDKWDPAWDDNSAASGLTWANNISTALTSANVDAFLYWWGAAATSAGDDAMLINLPGGDAYQASGRLWAFANFARFIRPGAQRIGASTPISNLVVSAYTSGSSTIVVAINNGQQAVQSTVSVTGGTGTLNQAVPYVTNAGSTVAQGQVIAVSGGAFTASVPARSVVTYVVS
jgi:O-glycosyl hydrolase